jgi:hypothetical protein
VSKGFGEFASWGLDYFPQGIPKLPGNVYEGWRGPLGGSACFLHGGDGLGDDFQVQERDRGSEVGGVFL